MAKNTLTDLWMECSPSLVKQLAGRWLALVPAMRRAVRVGATCTVIAIAAPNPWAGLSERGNCSCPTADRFLLADFEHASTDWATYPLSGNGIFGSFSLNGACDPTSTEDTQARIYGCFPNGNLEELKVCLNFVNDSSEANDSSYWKNVEIDGYELVTNVGPMGQTSCPDAWGFQGNENGGFTNLDFALPSSIDTGDDDVLIIDGCVHIGDSTWVPTSGCPDGCPSAPVGSWSSDFFFYGDPSLDQVIRYETRELQSSQNTISINGQSLFMPGSDPTCAQLSWAVTIDSGTLNPGWNTLTITPSLVSGTTATDDFAVIDLRISGACPTASSSCDGAPRASFSYSPNQPEQGESVVFEAQTSGADTYTWDFGADGNDDATGEDPLWVFNASGPHPVKLTVSNAYGTDSITKIVQVGSIGTAPSVIGVFREYPGVFLEGVSVPNRFDVSIDWQGTPGMVLFSIDGGAPTIEFGTAAGASHTFDMGSEFPPSWRPIEITITPSNAEGVTGDPWTERLSVFPYPTFLELALENGLGLSITAGNGEIRASFDFQVPEEPFSGNITVPEWVPYISGTFGVTDTQAYANGYASSLGLGEVNIGGMTGFKAMGIPISGQVDGQGRFRFGAPEGLRLSEASFQLDLSGTITKELGIVEAIPGLSAGAGLPILDWFNDRVKLIGEVTPSLELAASVRQDGGGELRFNDGRGTLGVGLKATLAAELIPNRLEAAAWLAGSGSFTLGLPEPFLREAEVHAEAGVTYFVDAFFVVFDGTYLCDVTCTWTPATGTECPSQCGAVAKAASPPSVSLLRPNYERYGPYAQFVPRALAKRSDARVPVSVQQSVLEENIFVGASPVRRSAGTGELLLWEHQDPVETLETDLMWSYDDGTGWSAPQAVATDPQSDLSPAAGLDGSGKLVAAWARLNDPSFSAVIETAEDLPLFYTKLEIATATWDPATAKWGPVALLTSDTAFDGDVRIASAATGSLLLTWLSNPVGDFLSAAASPSTLMYSWWDATAQAWSAPQVLASGLTGVSSHASAASSAAEAIVLIPRDPDLTMADDGVIDQYTWDGSSWTGPLQFAAGEVENRLPTVVYEQSGQARLVWLRGADLVTATLSDPTPQTVRAGSESMAFYGAQLLTNDAGNLTLVWQEVVDNGPANLFAAIFDDGTQTWSADRRLTQESTALHYDFNGYYGGDGILRGTYLASQIGRIDREVTLDDNQTYTFTNIPERQQTDLRLLEHSLIRNLAVNDDDLVLMPSRPTAGEPATAELTVHNAGDFATTGFDVELYVGEPESGGVPVDLASVTGPLPAGGTADLAFAFDWPDAGGDLVALVDPADLVLELTDSDNRARVYLTNAGPVAAIHADLTSGTAPLTVLLDVATSFDPDGDPIEYRWSFADGSTNAEGPIVTHTFSNPGRYPVTLTVTDDRGGVSTVTVLITVGPLPPAPALVPDGAAVPGMSMQVNKAGDDLQVLWDVTTCGMAPDYNLYAGVIGDFAKVTESACELGVGGTATVSLEPGQGRWWIVTGTNGLDVGSFGRYSTGQERILTGWGAYCGVGTTDRTGTCE